MKQLIVASAFGRVVGEARNAIEMLRAACFDRQSLGTLTNDHLASLLIAKLCRPNQHFVDVGAHIGSIVAAVAHHDASVHIVAIEAMPEKVASLRRWFPAVEVHECAAGASDGQASFFVNTKRTGYSSLGRPEQDTKADIREIHVAVKTLDALLDSARVDAMKIDVEGAELGVLLGAEKLVANCNPTIMFESGPPSDDGLGYTKEALWQWFHDHDYGVYVPNRVAHNGQGLTQEGFVESHLYPRRTTNYFAIANRRRREIRDLVRSSLGIVE